MSKTAKILYSGREFEFLISLRHKGHSKPPYDSLNLGLNTGDDIVLIAKNRKRFLKKIKADGDSLVFARQVHSGEVKYVRQSGYYLDVDGFVTDNKNLLLSLTVADCFPVFLGDRGTGLFSLLHMGWRGTAAGILKNAVDILIEKGSDPAEIIMAIGPGIGADYFEVGAELRKFFPDEKYWRNFDGEKGYLNLNSIIIDQFLCFGGKRENIYNSEECTYKNADEYFSYRRDGKLTGRMMAVARRKN